MVILYGNDRATGEEAETASEMKATKTIFDLDDCMSRNEFQDPSPTASSGSIESQETEGAMHEVAEAIKDCAAALREENAIMRELHQPPISGEETWKLIKECVGDTRLLPMIYCSLMKDVSNLRTVLQCPVQARKEVIMHIVFGSSDPPSY